MPWNQGDHVWYEVVSKCLSSHTGVIIFFPSLFKNSVNVSHHKSKSSWTWTLFFMHIFNWRNCPQFNSCCNPVISRFHFILGTNVLDIEYTLKIYGQGYYNEQHFTKYNIRGKKLVWHHLLAQHVKWLHDKLIQYCQHQNKPIQSNITHINNHNNIFIETPWCKQFYCNIIQFTASTFHPITDSHHSIQWYS